MRLKIQIYPDTHTHTHIYIYIYIYIYFFFKFSVFFSPPSKYHFPLALLKFLSLPHSLLSNPKFHIVQFRLQLGQLSPVSQRFRSHFDFLFVFVYVIFFNYTRVLIDSFLLASLYQIQNAKNF